MSLTPPSASNRYQVTDDHDIGSQLWNEVHASLADRLAAVETAADGFEDAVSNAAIAAAQALLANAVVPQIENVQDLLTAIETAISLAEDRLQALQTGGVVATNVTLSAIAGLASANVQSAFAEVVGLLAAEVTARNTAIAAETTARNAAISAIPIVGQEAFKATGTLPNGAPVVLNADGTVSTVTSNTDTLGTATVFRSATTTYIATAALPGTDKVVVCYYDGTNVQAVIGTISGTGVSFGAAQTVRGASVTSLGVCATSSTTFVVAWGNSPSSVGEARLGVVAGSAINFPNAWVSFYAANVANQTTIAALSSTSVIIAFTDPSNMNSGVAVIGNITGGTTLNFASTRYDFAGNATTSSIAIAVMSPTSVVISYQVGTPGQRVIAGTISGSVINFGSFVSVDTSTYGTFSSIVALTSTTFMVAWARGTTDGRAKIGTVSGTTVSFTGASDVVFNSGNTAYISATKLSATSVMVAYSDTSNFSYGTLNVGTVSGTSISFGAKIYYRSNGAVYTAAVPLTDRFFIGYQEQSNGYGNGVVFQPAATNVADWEGLTASLINDGTFGVVKIRGGIASNLSGLTPKADYYLTNAGALTTTVTPYKVGRALSATKLRLSGNA